ncbi:MAG: FAD-dependent oxidoreductase [Bdellovibrio sp.]
MEALKSDFFDTIIVGAGVCGLRLSENLSKLFPQERILLLEKSKAIGGRVASRRAPGLYWNHGAQFYKSSAELNSWHQDWIQKNLVVRSQLGPSSEKISTEVFFPKGEFTQLLKETWSFLQDRVALHREQKVVRIKRDRESWRLLCLSGAEGLEFEELICRRLVLTCPLPQSLQILDDSKIPYPETLKNFKYAPVVVGLYSLRIKGPLFFQHPHSLIASLSIQSTSTQLSSLSLVLKEEISRELFSANTSQIAGKIEEILQQCLNKLDVSISQLSLHSIKKWRYSHSEKQNPQISDLNSDSHRDLFLRLGDSAPSLFLAGDAFGGPSIAGALRSAEALSTIC